jgi:Fe-S-cluster containining protein
VGRQRREFDCTRCGACCCNPDENRAEGYSDYVEIKSGDEILMRPAILRRLVVMNAQGVPHMKMIHERCAALEGPVGRRALCSIYEVRPSPCRRMEAGSDACLARRKERGVDE